jgi:CheY-like chemotaxis protein
MGETLLLLSCGAAFIRQQDRKNGVGHDGQAPTGSMTVTNTIGTVRVACSNGAAVAVPVAPTRASGASAAKAHAAGCEGYVAKPYSPRQLLAKIREYIK